MGHDFDPLSLTPEQRPDYEYEGPEVIYTFWAKHGPCQATECCHRTPILTTPVVALKKLTVKAWMDRECKSCGEKYDIEQREARMAPAAMLVVAETESPFAVMGGNGSYSCPHCDEEYRDQKAANDGESASLGKAKNKKIDFTLLVHPDWMKGSSGRDIDGNWFGGSVTDSAKSTAAWNQERARTLKLIEVRGKLPEKITCPDNGLEFFTDDRSSNVPSRSKFKCQEDTCGRVEDFLSSVVSYGKTAPAAVYMIHGHCPLCNENREPYGGRFFSADGQHLALDHAQHEWDNSESLRSLCPNTTIPKGLETSVRTPLDKYQYNRWSDFFNPRQSLVLTRLLNSIVSLPSGKQEQLVLLSAFQQYLRNQNMFCIWDISRDCMAPFLSKNNMHPPTRPVENGVFHRLGRGNWSSCADTVVEALNWQQCPYELVSVSHLLDQSPQLDGLLGSSKSFKVSPLDPVGSNVNLTVGSSTALNTIGDGECDLVITDPPFGDIMQYSELSGFFYAWLRPTVERISPGPFSAEQPPTALEAVDNYHRHGKQDTSFYQRILTECWREAARILKPGGLLSFTFHHDKDGPWISVLESLFDAGFYLEAAFPIRSDETKGEGSKPGTFGAQKVEFDIIHVCRKRLHEPNPISWARLRRQIMRDVRQLQEIIEHHQDEGLGEADLQVIRRGKALEYFSRHYGKVYVEKGREDEFTVKEALLGINQLLDDESDTTTEAPPVLAEPYTRQFLRLFADKSSLERDQLQKYLRGTGVSPSEFIDRGWCTEKKKIFTVTPPLEWAQEWKGVNRKAMSRDFDQSYFLVGACYDDSGIKVSDTLNSPKFGHHPAIPDLLDWFGKHGSDPDMRAAAKRAKQLYSSWVAKNTDSVQKQQTLFDLEED
jgi:hypothetical protein